MRILQHCLTHRKIDAFQYDLVQTKTTFLSLCFTANQTLLALNSIKNLYIKPLKKLAQNFSQQTLTKATIKKQEQDIKEG